MPKKSSGYRNDDTPYGWYSYSHPQQPLLLSSSQQFATRSADRASEPCTVDKSSTPVLMEELWPLSGNESMSAWYEPQENRAPSDYGLWAMPFHSLSSHDILPVLKSTREVGDSQPHDAIPNMTGSDYQVDLAEIAQRTSDQNRPAGNSILFGEVPKHDHGQVDITSKPFACFFCKRRYTTKRSSVRHCRDDHDCPYVARRCLPMRSSKVSHTREDED